MAATAGNAYTALHLPCSVHGTFKFCSLELSRYFWFWFCFFLNILHPWLVESANAKPKDSEGQSFSHLTKPRSTEVGNVLRDTPDLIPKIIPLTCLIGN